jgi:3-oxoacyl-[acyl-carrier protein] reductase
MNRRVAFVTGGAKGLGHAMVKALIDAGWNVFFTYRTSRCEADVLVDYAAEHDKEAAYAQADLTLRHEVENAVRACLERFGKIDAFIHNFGPFVFERHPLSDYTDDMWRRMMDGNLTNFFWIYRMVVPGMRQRGFGRIVTIGYDGAAHAEGWRFRGAYAAAKAGLAALTRTVAREERQNGITCNMVCPGDIRGSYKMAKIGDLKEHSTGPMRPPVGEDVARVVVFLCDEASQKLSGTVTEVTGGYDVLAYDDGTDAILEPVLYQIGDSVWVYPWECRGTVIDVTKIPNRHVVYTVTADDHVGKFTAYQLRDHE